MPNYLLMLLLIFTLAMFAITRIQEARARRLARQIEEES